MQEHVRRCDRNSINILLLAISLEPGMYLMNIVGNGVIKQGVQKSIETRTEYWDPNRECVAKWRMFHLFKNSILSFYCSLYP